MTGLLQSSGRNAKLDLLQEKPVLLFSAIGNPEGFRNSVVREKYDVQGTMSFADHYEFSRKDIAAIGRAAKESGAQVILCTHKDLVKVGVDAIEGIPVYAVLIEIEFLNGLEKLEGAIEQVISGC